MKHTITINEKNTVEHIIHLDQHLPIQIKPLPANQAYQLQDTPIHTTTTKTLHKTTITQIRQKNKEITQHAHLIIIKNTKTIPTLQIKTIQENPQITTHTTTPQHLTTTLQTILQNNTPPHYKKTNIHKQTLYHDNTKVKTYTNQEYLEQIQTILNKKPQLTLQQAEYQAQRQYYQHISYDKTNQTYKITLNKKSISTHTKN